MKATLITLTNEAAIEEMFKIDATDLKRCVYNEATKEFYIVSEEGITVFYNGKSFDVENEDEAEVYIV